MTTAKKVLIGLGVFWVVVLGGLALILDLPGIIQVYFAQAQLEKLNYCSLGTECQDITLPGGCFFSSINSSEQEAAKKIIQGVAVQGNCDFFFRKVTFTCENQKCVPHETP